MGDDKKVKKVGMKEIQDPELEYEMSLVFSIDRDTHYVKPEKDRTGVFEGGDPFVITSNTGAKILDWCQLGIELKSEKPAITQVAFDKAVERIKKGELEVMAKVEAAFLLTEDQIKQFDELRPKV